MITFPAFAYTRGMEVILSLTSLVLNCITMYCVADSFLSAYYSTSSKRKRLLFSLVAGVFFQTALIYSVYFFGGAKSLSDTVYLLVVTPNPLLILLYYFLAVKIFRLGAHRSIKLVVIIYLFYLIAINFNRMMGTVFFVQDPLRYNYLLDLIQQVVFFAVLIISYYFFKRQLIKSNFFVISTDNNFIDLKHEVGRFFMLAAIYYIVSVCVPLAVGKSRTGAYLLILFFLILQIMLLIYRSINDSLKQELENKQVHIKSLTESIDEFSGIRHDFNNLLQTYGGYIELGDIEELRNYHNTLSATTVHAESALDLGMRMNENPALITLLLKKYDYAQTCGVRMEIQLNCPVDNFYMDNMDVCRCFACLIDNAVEAAQNSERKRVFLTTEYKRGGTKFIIITNSTAGPVNTTEILAPRYTSKSGHDGMGLYNTRKIVEKYRNCTFQIKYYDYEFSAYIGVREPS